MTARKDAHRLAEEGRVDPAAPAHATGGIDVAASPEEVWDALATVANWPRFRADVTDAETEGPADAPADAGRAFRWRAGGHPVESRFAITDRPSRLSWSNAAPGLTASCVYEFDRTPSGHTRIRAAESMDASAVAPHLDHAALAEGIRTWLEGIKAFVEERAHG
ncbi:SRPBCC family protein [Jiangella mangrovi]|uniref:Uncharacterized protein YndB with AHSA1/START domain n=1 Tax=Jiangella mangrovi TaxID=1524084 RepID=A0A7W9LNF7_9ACTN|nr:SRPBCC family protein [Jiangella mangrovi]MBB5790241.1 uncharacterized protein YndB with AHSA1/START domain [Jiangella mangrovi]